MIDALINALVVSLEKVGLGYLILDILSLFLIILLFILSRNIYNLIKKILDKLDILERSLDTEHLYSKLDRIENSLDMHQAEEIRKLHDVHNIVTRLDATLEARKEIRNIK